MFTRNAESKPGADRRRWGLAIAATGVALAAASACTPGQAVLGAGHTIPVGPISVDPIVTGSTGPYTAPTANLTRLANFLTFKHRSVTTQVSAPRHLNLTDPVSIKVQAGGVTEQAYDNNNGNVIVQNVIENNGAIYDQDAVITLTETLPNHQTTTFAINWRPQIEPLYNVDIGDLTWITASACTTGAKYLHINWHWRNADGSVDVDSNGQHFIGTGTFPIGYVASDTQLHQHYTAVGQRDGLLRPQFAFTDADAGAAFSWPAAQSLVVGPKRGYWSELVPEANGESCKILIRYALTESIVTYPSL